MEIIARMRAEREALVARIGQIDNMLRQYDEWGREAERLMSMTTSIPRGAVQPHSLGDVSEVSTPVNEALPHTPPRVSDIRADHPSLSSGLLTKTPIPEFEAAVIDVLREADEPMDRVALYEALTARGIVIGNGGRDKDLNTLSARVYRMAQDAKNRISGERGQGYRLTADTSVHDVTPGDNAKSSILHDLL